MAYLLFVLGLISLIGGGELLVQSGLSLAHKLRLSPLIIGIILMGVGTSLPELAASISAIVSTPPVPSIAFGNVIGSNISNILFILGLSALIHPIRINRENFRRDGMFLLLSVAILGFIMAFGYLDSIIGIFLLMFIAGYYFICYDKQEQEDISKPHVKLSRNAWVLGFLSILGIALIIFGADLLVDTASKIANTFGIPKSVMGLTVIAFGTSLPEITVSTVASIHKQSAVAFGNIVGSNIANIFLIIGAMGIIHSTPVPQMWQSFSIMAIVTAVLLLCGIIGRIPRWVGALLMLSYVLYIYITF